jgi:hypothetical protein
MGLNLVARLGLDGKAFQTGLARANRQTGQFAGGIKRQFVGMFGVAAIGVAIKKATDYADEINNLSRRLGVSTKALQEFNYAANLSGSDLKTVGTSLQRVQEAQERLKNGNKLAEESFKRLGFSAAAALSVNPAEVFRQAGEKYANTALTPEMFGDIRTLFGAEAGPRNIRIFTEDLKSMAEQANRAGAVLSDQQIQTAANLKDTMAVLKMGFLGPFGEALAILGNAAIEASAHFKAFLVGLAAWQIDNSEKSIWDMITGKHAGEGGAQKMPGSESIRQRMTENLQGQGLENWQIKKRVGISMSRAGKSTFGINYGHEDEDYKKARNDLIGETKKTSAFQQAFQQVLAEEKEKTKIRFEQQKAMRALLTSTGQMAPSGMGKAGPIKTDELARMGLFIGGRRNPLINAAEKQVEEIRGVKQEVETLNKQIKKKL